MPRRGLRQPCEILNLISNLASSVHSAASVPEAIDIAEQLASEDDTIVFVGSLFLVGEAKRLLQQRSDRPSIGSRPASVRGDEPLASKPLIGISCRMDAGKNRFYLRKDYSEAIFEAGGTPVLLPLIPHRDFSQELVKSLDGLVISGSNSDVDPQLYGEEPHPNLASVITRRDQTDLYLLESIFQKRKPLLAICFGIQILNVFLGGTLWQDVASQVQGAVKHSQDSSDDYRSHTVSIRSPPCFMSWQGRRKYESTAIITRLSTK